MESTITLMDNVVLKSGDTNISSFEKILLDLSPLCLKELLQQKEDITKECTSEFLNLYFNKSQSDINNELFNLTSAANINDIRPFLPPLWLQLFWSCLFGIMVFAAVFGNIIVIWIVLAHRKMRTVTNFFLLNLTIADLVTATFNAIFNFVFMLNSHWPFGNLYCVINNFIANLTIASSVFTITATSVDRYVAIVHPLKPRMTKKTAVTTLVIIWVCASIFAFPTLIYSRMLTYKYAKQEIRTICILVWPDGPAGHSVYDNIYNMLFLVLTYILPIVSMAITYTLIARVLWGSKVIGEETELQRESIKSKRKVVRMLITVVVIFAICWLPYHSYFLYTYYYPEVVHFTYIQHVYLFIYWLAMSNSMFNWMIYFWRNKRFRNYFKRYLLCCVKGNCRELRPQRINGYNQSPTTRCNNIALSNLRGSTFAKRYSSSRTEPNESQI